jgi:hypothetical protein
VQFHPLCAFLEGFKFEIDKLPREVLSQ